MSRLRVTLILATVVISMLSSTVRAFASSSSRCTAPFIRSASAIVTQRSATAPFRFTAQPTMTTMATTRMFSTGSTEEGEKSIVDTCRDKIIKAMETDDVVVKGAFDDPNGSHISIEVVSELFEGKRAVQRQQLVYKAIWEEMQGAVHAVDSMICKTPDEK